MVGWDQFGDPPACPLLGLALDPRTRYTFPHPGHRCHAMGSPGEIEPGRQSTYCLSPNFTACDRHQAWQRRAATTTAAPVWTVIHVIRASDSLARIAAAYGVTVELIAAARRSG